MNVRCEKSQLNSLFRVPPPKQANERLPESHPFGLLARVRYTQ